MSACNNFASIKGFAAHVDNTSICKNIASTDGFTAYVENLSTCKDNISNNNLVVLVNGVTTFINRVTMFVNRVTAFIDDAPALIHSIVAHVESTLPLHSQLRSQSPLGVYGSVSALVCQCEISTFNLSFLDETTHSTISFDYSSFPTMFIQLSVDLSPLGLFPTPTK